MNGYSDIRRCILVMFFTGLYCSVLFGTAAQAENMRFRGTLLESPPCTINNGQPVEIDFGDVGVNKIDGRSYRQKFELRYHCEGTGTDKVLRYLGTATAFDKGAVQSNVADFGIRLTHLEFGVETPTAVGDVIPVPAERGVSQFIATPVKKPGATLAEGAFTAAATLQLEYP